MIILLGSQKGGCGKSTIAINIACSLEPVHNLFNNKAMKARLVN